MVQNLLKITKMIYLLVFQKFEQPHQQFHRRSNRQSHPYRCMPIQRLDLEIYIKEKESILVSGISEKQTNKYKEKDGKERILSALQ